MKDIELKISIRNNLLKQKRFKFIKQPFYKYWPKELGSYQVYLRYETFQQSPIDKRELRKGKIAWRPSVLRIVNYFNCSPEELFDIELYDRITKNSITVEVESQRLLAEAAFQSERNLLLSDYSVEHEVDKISLPGVVRRVLATLPPREERVLRQRFGLGTSEMTLVEIGEEEEVGRERVRQIEEGALRKLRHYSRGAPLKNFVK